jgi:hypothetical protein
MERKILYPLTVCQKLNTPLIMDISAIDLMGITYLSISESFMFQEDIICQSKLRKVDLMTAGIKSVTTIGNPYYPALFLQPSLVVSNHRVMSQYCC